MYLAPLSWSAAFGMIVVSAACSATVRTARPSDRSWAGLRYALTERELERTGVGTAYEAMERLRAEYSRIGRGQTGDDEVPVYVDGTRMTGVLLLRGIPSSTIALIGWVTPQDATTRFGTGHSSGAIVIVTRYAR